MSLNIYNKDFQNWLKGAFGLSTTRDALIECISDKLDDALKQIYSKPDTSSSDLEQYFLCLETSEIHGLVPKVKETRWGCTHSKCQTLMNHFIINHFKERSLHYRWKWERKPSSIYENGNENSDLKLKIILLYLCMYKKPSAKKYTSLNCLDISQLLKLIESCKLIFPNSVPMPSTKVLESRNKIMHSPNYMITDEDTCNIVKYLRELLDCFNIAEKTSYKDAVQNLESFKEKDFVVMYQSEDCKRIISKVKKARDIADDLYQAIKDNNQPSKSQSKILVDELESITGFECTTKWLETNHTEYKIMAKKGLKMKCEAVELDKTEYNENSDQYKEMENLIRKAKQDIQEIEEAMMKEIIDLKKETETIKEEMKQQKIARTWHGIVTDMKETDTQKVQEDLLPQIEKKVEPAFNQGNVEKYATQEKVQSEPEYIEPKWQDIRLILPPEHVERIKKENELEIKRKNFEEEKQIRLIMFEEKRVRVFHEKYQLEQERLKHKERLKRLHLELEQTQIELDKCMRGSHLKMVAGKVFQQFFNHIGVDARASRMETLQKQIEDIKCQERKAERYLIFLDRKEEDIDRVLSDLNDRIKHAIEETFEMCEKDEMNKECTIA